MVDSAKPESIPEDLKNILTIFESFPEEDCPILEGLPTLPNWIDEKKSCCFSYEEARGRKPSKFLFHFQQNNHHVECQNWYVDAKECKQALALTELSRLPNPLLDIINEYVFPSLHVTTNCSRKELEWILKMKPKPPLSAKKCAEELLSFCRILDVSRIQDLHFENANIANGVDALSILRRTGWYDGKLLEVGRNLLDFYMFRYNREKVFVVDGILGRFYFGGRPTEGFSEYLFSQEAFAHKCEKFLNVQNLCMCQHPQSLNSIVLYQRLWF